MVKGINEVCFTDEDKVGFCVKIHTADEIKSNKKLFKRKNRVRNFILAGLFIISAAAVWAGPIVSTEFVVEYVADITFFAVCFLVLVFMFVDRKNYKIAGSRYYIEILVDKKLPAESELNIYVNSPASTSHYYPVEGRDTSTGYVSLCYIGKEEYNRVNIGETIKINVKGAKL